MKHSDVFQRLLWLQLLWLQVVLGAQQQQVTVALEVQISAVMAPTLILLPAHCPVFLALLQA